ILLQLLLADIEPGAAYRPLRELQEGLLEDALRTVARQDLLVDAGTGQSPVGHLRRYAPGGGFGLDALQEGAKIATADLCSGLSEGGRGKAGQEEYRHCRMANKAHSDAPCVEFHPALDILCDGRAAGIYESVAGRAF